MKKTYVTKRNRDIYLAVLDDALKTAYNKGWDDAIQDMEEQEYAGNTQDTVHDPVVGPHLNDQWLRETADQQSTHHTGGMDQGEWDAFRSATRGTKRRGLLGC